MTQVAMNTDNTAALSQERWLDKQLAARLSVFSGNPVPEDSLLLSHALRRWQLVHLSQTLEHAAGNTVHYRTILAGYDTLRAALTTSDITDATPETLHRIQASLAATLHSLPFTLPEELARHPESFLAVGQDDVAGVISLPTSGTTGPGKRIFCTQADLAETIAFFSHGMRFMVAREYGDSVALLMSGDREGSVGDLLQQAMTTLGVPCLVPGFPVDEEKTLDALLDFQPTCLVGVPGHVLSLARNSRAPLLRKSLRSVLLSGDSVTPQLRNAIAEAFACKVFVHYGLTETGLGGAVECPALTGCHMREADLIFEIVNEQGQPLADGVWGEVVLTTLTRQAMPLIRYRTGDAGRIIPDACACGSVFKRIEVRGRMRETIPLPQGSLLHITDLDAHMYALPWLRGYQAVLYGTGETHQNTAPSYTLVILANLTENAPADAQTHLEHSLASLPGVQVFHYLQENAAPSALLPVMVRTTAREDCAATFPALSTFLSRSASIRAKQSIQRTTEPLPSQLYSEHPISR